MWTTVRSVHATWRPAGDFPTRPNPSTQPAMVLEGARSAWDNVAKTRCPAYPGRRRGLVGIFVCPVLLARLLRRLLLRSSLVHQVGIEERTAGQFHCAISRRRSRRTLDFFTPELGFPSSLSPSRWAQQLLSSSSGHLFSQRCTVCIHRGHLQSATLRLMKTAQDWGLQPPQGPALW